MNSVVFGRRCLFVTTGIKWWAAMERPELLDRVRDYFRELARLLDSKAFILHRENGCQSWDWVLEGLTLDEIEREFRNGGAGAATNLDELPHSGPEVPKTSYYREAVA